MTSLSNLFKKNYLSQVAVLLLLSLLLIIGAFPGYFQGKWQWQEPPPVSKLKELKSLRQTGLTIRGWQTVEQTQKTIDKQKWSLQVVKKQGEKTQAIIMLLPQNGPKNQPQVEWTTLKSFWDWDIAQYELAKLNVQPLSDLDGQKNQVTARFFRGSTDKQTFAVLQWYAWQNGGHPWPSQWFMVDQKAQWQRQRAAWVAVSIVLPMEPLGQVKKYWHEVEALGQQVQTALNGTF